MHIFEDLCSGKGPKALVEGGGEQEIWGGGGTSQKPVIYLL